MRRDGAAPAYHPVMPGSHLVPMLSGAGKQIWTLTASGGDRYRLLTITRPDNITRDAEGPDCRPRAIALAGTEILALSARTPSTPGQSATA